MRRLVIGLLLAGCGAGGGSGEDCESVEGGAPCCVAPPLPCDEPTRADTPVLYVLACEPTTGPFEVRAHDDTLSQWGPDQRTIESFDCWVGVGHVGRVSDADGALTCYDRDGAPGDCAIVGPDLDAARNAYYAANPRQE